MSSSFLSRAILTLALAALPTLCWAQTDQIYQQGGTPTRGLIGKTTPDEVEVTAAGTTRKIPTNTIRKINFSGEPNELRTARDHAAQGRYEDAGEVLAKVDFKSLTRPLVKQDYQYIKAFSQAKLALTGGGDKAQAEKDLLGFFGANQSTFHAYECAEILGDLAVARQDYENAGKRYGYLAKAPWKDYQMRSSVLQASAMLGQGNYAEAKAKFDEVVSSPLDDPAALEQKRQAKVGQALCLAETGDPAAGIKLVQEVIGSNEPQQNPVLFGRAYNSLGRCYLKSNKPKDALMAYLHVDVLFYQNPETHAEALYYLNKLWTEVKKSERAIQSRTLLQSRYAGSSWAKKP